MKSSSNNLTHKNYRPDIDGLRAFSVFFVIGYHAFPKIFKAGFIGVDIFFVISGYLISSIIIGNLRRVRNWLHGANMTNTNQVKQEYFKPHFLYL